MSRDAKQVSASLVHEEVELLARICKTQDDLEGYRSRLKEIRITRAGIKIGLEHEEAKEVESSK